MSEAARPGRLAGKVALITGAGAGIGRAAAQLFAAEGARVAIIELDPETGERTLAEVRTAGGDAIFCACDVGGPEQVARAVRHTVEHFGKLDVLYNNAGGSTPRDGQITKTTDEEFWHAIRLNLFGTWLFCRNALPHIIAAGGGSIINTSSIGAEMGLNGRDAYTASKGGVSALTRSLAVEYAPQKVRVNALAPSRTQTERLVKLFQAGHTSSALDQRHLLGWATPLDVAQAAVYLASDESRVTTGQVLRIDSGISIS
jgi:NAD(P)-dependent dehydrogenase (short-subunit alcohol dehydrogenase family)